MFFWKRVVVSLFLLFGTACSRTEPPFTDNSKDSELYAQSMRRTVLMLVDRARSGDRATQMGIIAEELNQTDRPFGDYRDLFTEMRDVANDALDICRDAGEGGKPAIESQLADLTRLAEQLPRNPDATGDVIPAK